MIEDAQCHNEPRLVVEQRMHANPDPLVATFSVGPSHTWKDHPGSRADDRAVPAKRTAASGTPRGPVDAPLAVLGTRKFGQEVTIGREHQEHQRFAGDLAVFVEQLPTGVHAAADGEESSIDFYEQGVERFLTFRPSGAAYSVTCESRTDWAPEPNVETIAQPDLIPMLAETLTSFLDCLESSAPQLREHPWIVEWAAAG